MADTFPPGKEVGTFSDVQLDPGRKAGQPAGARKKLKAIMFVPEGTQAHEADLDVQVVSVDQATFDAMGPRRC